MKWSTGKRKKKTNNNGDLWNFSLVKDVVNENIMSDWHDLNQQKSLEFQQQQQLADKQLLLRNV